MTSEAISPVDFPHSRKLLIFGIMAFGQFMALIDIQIVAASLNDVQAGLSAGPDEISWVQTAYLMAELVMVPLSAFLAQALSTRGLFALSAGLFTLSSALCGLAWDIHSMILFRAIQGFVGGAMIPTVFATGYAMFTGKDRALIPAILGVVSTLAPSLGPTVGGWITDALGWRWIFYVNVAPGLATTIASWIVLKGVDRAQPEMLKRIDYTHLLALAAFLAGTEYVLEEGQRHDWFGDIGIATAAWIAFVAFLLFLERSFRSANPVVKLTAFRSPTFAIACVFNLVIGFGLYASTYLTPAFLGRVRGFNSSEIGAVVCVVGATQLLGAFVASKLSRLDPRWVITPGLIAFASSLWLLSYVTPQWGFWQLLTPQLLRGFAVVMCISPSVTLALGTFQGPELRYASGLFNLMRNLGGAVGIALVNVWLYDGTRSAAERFGENLSRQGQGAAAFFSELTAHFTAVTGDAVGAAHLASGEFARLVGQQALAVGFEDVFRKMAWLFIFALVLVPLCRPAKAGNPAAAAESH